MRKKKKTLLARARIMVAIPRDLYYQTSGVFGVGITLLFLAALIPVALHAYRPDRSTAMHAQSSPMLKAHIQDKPRKSVV